MKKIKLLKILIICVSISLCFMLCISTYKYQYCGGNKLIFAESNLNVVDELQQEVETELDNLNAYELDDLLSNLTEQQKNIFNGISVVDKIKNLINGTDSFAIGDIFKVLLVSIFDNITAVIPILASICAIAILGSLLMQMRGNKMSQSLADVIHFACYGVIVVLVFAGVVELVNVTSSTLTNLKSQMEISFPILLTLMASLGSTTSVAIYQPLVAVLCGIMMQAFLKIILPIFSLNLIFGVVGNLSGTVKLSKFSNFLTSLFKTIVGFAFTIFASFLAVSGIVAGSYDSVSIRATKFAIKSYIPLVGGYISDGFNLILTSSVLIKNAIGYTGIIVIFLTIISPLVKIYLYKLGLSLVAGIIEPVADKRVTEFVSSTAKGLTMLASIILAFSFAYIICMGLVMCSSNLV